MEIKRSNITKINDVNFNSIKFGEIFTDHMFECNFKNGQWESPIIKPYESLILDPSTHVFHYGQAIFEGMKGYKDKADQLWLFRPEENYNRLEKSCIRMNIPVLPKKFFFDGLNIKLLILFSFIKTFDAGTLLLIRADSLSKAGSCLLT